jgi:uncharacterized protein YqjF (DUF2071 family)
MPGQIPIASRFASSVIVAFPCRTADLQALVSPRFAVDEFDGSAYLAIAVVDQVETRPQGFPPQVGKRIGLIEYLVFATYNSPSGQPLSGLVLVHSETDSRLAALVGHLFSPYRLDHVDIQRTISSSQISIKSTAAQLSIEARRSDRDAPHTLGELAKPRSFNFVERGKGRGILINRGILKGWQPVELHIDHASSDWLDQQGVSIIGPPRALIVEDVRYLFKRHRVDAP